VYNTVGLSELFEVRTIAEDNEIAGDRFGAALARRDHRAAAFNAQMPHTSENVTQIVANHSDGQSLTMDFGLIQGTTINEHLFYIALRRSILNTPTIVPVRPFGHALKAGLREY
jgi:hypothetical protein